MTSRTLAARLAALLAATAALAVPDPSAAQAAGAWAPPIRLAENARTTPGGVAVAPDGTVVAAFARQTANPPASFVEVAVKPPGGSFGAPVSLGPGYSPRLASDAEGNVAVVWEQHIAGTSIVTGVTQAGGRQLHARPEDLGHRVGCGVSAGGHRGRQGRCGVAAGRVPA